MWHTRRGVCRTVYFSCGSCGTGRRRDRARDGVCFISGVGACDRASVLRHGGEIAEGPIAWRNIPREVSKSGTYRYIFSLPRVPTLYLRRQCQESSGGRYFQLFLLLAQVDNGIPKVGHSLRRVCHRRVRVRQYNRHCCQRRRA